MTPPQYEIFTILEVLTCLISREATRIPSLLY